MDWQKYEDIVYEECNRIYPHAQIEKNIKLCGRITGTPRQVDVLVVTDKEKIAYDSKLYKKCVDVKLIESMVGMYSDLGVDKLVVVTEKGYSTAALKRAHYGEESVEADILSLSELQIYQAEMAIPYAGSFGVLLKPPFGWVVDISRQQSQFSAVLYKRGCANLDEAGSQREWGYCQFWNKQGETIDSLEKLLLFHRDEYQDIDVNGQLSVLVDEKELKVTSFFSASYPTKEYIGYKDFPNFIFFVVMFCCDEVAKRDVGKLYKMMRDLTLINVIQHKDGL